MDLNRRITIDLMGFPVQNIVVTFGGAFDGKDIHGIMREIVLQYRKKKNQMRRDLADELASTNAKTTVVVQDEKGDSNG